MNDEEKQELKRPIIEACIKSAHRHGWSDAAGMLWGTLFLESNPLTLDMIAEKTGYSKTTVRSNMNHLENLGRVRRVVGPSGKLHRYSLVSDTETIRSVTLSAAKDEINSVLQALLQIKKNLDGCRVKNAELDASLAKSIQFYEEMNRSFDLLSQFTSKELIDILESKKNRGSRELSDK